jgi:hypothetical protein
MRNISQCSHDRTAKRCAICGGRFGLIRYYSWRTALCSGICLDQFRTRRERDRRWLFRSHAQEQVRSDFRQDFAA